MLLIRYFFGDELIWHVMCIVCDIFFYTCLKIIVDDRELCLVLIKIDFDVCRVWSWQMKQLSFWGQFLMRLMVMGYVNSYFQIFSQMILLWCKLQMVTCQILLIIGLYFLFLQDGMLRPRELEELFSTAPER